jgi:hypothetical protein
VVIKLKICLFNLSFSLVVFLTKLIALSASVLGGFGALKLLHSNIPFALFYGLCFFEGNLLYSILFNRAFKIPERVSQVKMEMLMGSSRWRGSSRECRGIQRFVMSVGWLGLWSGNFTTLERESVLLFADFAIRQVVSLLLAFRK